MDIKETIRTDLKTAMKNGEVMVRDTLRMLDSAIKNEEIAKLKRDDGLSGEELLAVLQRLIKQRRESAAQYEQGGRPDLAEKEQAEMEILAKYLPAQLSEEEVRLAVKKIIAENGAPQKSEMGKFIGLAMKDLKGKTDGNLVRKIVEEELTD